MTIAGRRGWSVAAVAALVLLGGVGRTVHAGQEPQPPGLQVPRPPSPGQTPQQQNQGLPQNPMGQPPALNDASTGGKYDDPTMSVRARQAKAREDERQKRLVTDSEKLLILATQLHNEVMRTNKDILSLDVIKRADEIEKLAHSVKLGMKE